MRYIDAFNHFFPKRYFDALLESPAAAKDIGKRVRGIPALFDLDQRLRVVEQFENYRQVLSHGLPPVERLFPADKSPEMARIANDGLAEIVAKNPLGEECYASPAISHGNVFIRTLGHLYCIGL